MSPLRTRRSQARPSSDPWRPPAPPSTGRASVLHQRRPPQFPSGAHVSRPQAGPRGDPGLTPTGSWVADRGRRSPGWQPFPLGDKEPRPAPGRAEPEAKTRFPAGRREKDTSWDRRSRVETRAGRLPGSRALLSPRPANWGPAGPVLGGQSLAPGPRRRRGWARGPGRCRDGEGEGAGPRARTGRPRA